MLIADMDYQRCGLYVQDQRGEAEDKEEYIGQKDKSGDESGKHKEYLNRPHFNKKRGVHHHLLLLLPSNKGEHYGKNLQIFRIRPSQPQ